jgi:hypothetical protein
MSDGDSTPIQTSLQMLRDAIVGGVEAVKATISRWTCVDAERLVYDIAVGVRCSCWRK